MSTQNLQILLVESDDAEARRFVRALLDDPWLPPNIDRVADLAECGDRLLGGFYDALVWAIPAAHDDAPGAAARVGAWADSIPVVLLSDGPETPLLAQAARTHGLEWIDRRQWRPDELRRAVRNAVERRRLQKRIEQFSERFELAAEGARDGLWDWDLVQDTISFSPRCRALLGFAEGETVEKASEWLARIHADDLPRFHRQMDAHLKGLSRVFEVEYRALQVDGSARWIGLRGVARRDGSGRAVRIAGSQCDITAQRIGQSSVAVDPFHDPLTGLPNRFLLASRAGRAVERSRARPDQAFAILSIDCDGFSIINDGLGHANADQIIVLVAQRLYSCVRPGDMLARTGGDEFTILLDGIRGIEDAYRVAHRIHAELSSPFHVDDREVFVSVGIGISISTTGYEEAEECLRDAVTAMYRAKAEGKGRLVVFDRKMHAAAVARLELESELHRAVVNDEFVLHYQPVLSLVTGRIVGFEALIRWQHPRRGLVFPDEFIPAAEENGLIGAIGRWALETACVEASQWPQQVELLDAPWVSVNLSYHELTEDTIQFIERLLKSHDPQRNSFHLHLELTERIFLGDTEKTGKLLRRLRHMGVRLAIDDFGTGYSSLNYLRHFPVEYLKIDGSFIEEMSSGHGSAEIVRTILQLGRNLGMSVIAEKVETAEQLELLHRMRCECAQGRFFSGPVDFDTASAMLAEDFHWSFATPSRSRLRTLHGRGY